MRALKIGLLVNSTRSSKYEYDLALWARGQANIKISHRIVYARHRDSELGRVADIFLTQGLYALLSKLLFRLIVSVEKLLLKRSNLHSDHYQIFDLGKLVDEVLTIVTIELTEEVLRDSGSVITNGLRRGSSSSASLKSSTRGKCWSEARSERASSIL